MRTLILISAIVFVGQFANAKKNCTDVPKAEWMKEADFKQKMEAEGYKIRNFKQPGTCYEIYGTNKEGKNVEVYFNPANGSVVKSKDL